MAALDAATESEIARFVAEEARLLDTRQWEAWLALFAEDGFYWVPAALDQTDPFGHASIIHEDPSVLRLRVRRLSHPRLYSADPMPRTAHLIGAVTVARATETGAEFEARSTQFVAEYRPGDATIGTARDARRLYAGQVLHRLRRAPGGGWRIALKRFDLIDADGVLGIMAVPI